MITSTEFHYSPSAPHDLWLLPDAMITSTEFHYSPQHHMIYGPFQMDIGLYQYTKETAHEYDLYFVGTEGNLGRLMEVMGALSENRAMMYYHFLSFKLFALLLDLLYRNSPRLIWSHQVREEFCCAGTELAEADMGPSGEREVLLCRN
jgi:hypothetical protein